jgi:DNA-binding LytR/AlgR family response regulator
MPDADGFRVLEEFPEFTRPLVVFVTAHDDRALQAFAVQRSTIS